MPAETSGLLFIKYLWEKCVSRVMEFFVDLLMKLASRMPLPVFGHVRLHFAELKLKISQMPFIYQNLPSDVLTDFVEIDMRGLDSDLLRRPHQTFELDYEQRIRNHKHVILFGKGGIGKTTYLRRSILDVIGAKGQSARFGQTLVPFYVPLKAIENSEELPILNYLLRNNSLLSGERGMLRLAKLASKYRLFLCLDGYDEIPFPNADPKSNFVLREIIRLMTNSSGDHNASLTPEQSTFYEYAKFCRVWITSRVEFYTDHRFEFDPGTLTMEIVGVPAKNRAQLVKHVFDRYKDELKKQYDVEISHELFVQSIDRSRREEIIELSYSPLFLTVMAYIYVKAVMDERHYDVRLIENVTDLVGKCVILLLRDLDKERARGMSAAHRDALLLRRSEWIEEKIEFLRYFSLQTLLGSQLTFSVEDLRAHAEHFFTHDHVEGQSENILHSIRTQSALPGFVDQLIYCGLFVQVERSESGVLYDFPHRKFREVLAARYLAGLGNPQSVLGRFVGEPPLQESLYGFFEVTTFQDEILSMLCDAATRTDDRRYGTAVDVCLDREPLRYKHSEILWWFFLGCVSGGKRFRMPQRILSHVKPVPENLVFLDSSLQNSINRDDCYGAALSLELIQHCYGDAAMVRAAGMRLASEKGNRSIFGEFMYKYLVAKGALSEALLAALASERQCILDVGFALATFTAGELDMDSERIGAFSRLIKSVDEENVIPFFHAIRKANPRIIPLLLDKNVIPTRLEQTAWLCQKWDEEISSERPTGIITRDSIERTVQSAAVIPEERRRTRTALWGERGTVLREEHVSIAASTVSGGADPEQNPRSTDDDNPKGDLVSPAVRATLFAESALQAGLYDRAKQEISESRFVSPVLPLFFE
jgi:hypothetical protein